jgi:IS1 family transposase
MSNKLSFEKQKQLLHLMVEGNSVRGIARLIDVSPVTVLRHLEIAGSACLAYHDEHVRNLRSARIECDEIWSFNYCKDKNLDRAKAAPSNAGTVWTWTAIDPDSKLIVSFLAGDRGADTAKSFMTDVASRVSNRVQITTDGNVSYLEAIEEGFGQDVDFGQIEKLYGTKPDDKRHQFIGSKKNTLIGKPSVDLISTGSVEKQNQTMRQQMRRFTRKTACHSKKFENHVHMISLYTTWYNWARINGAVRISPAMASGLTDRLWGMDELVGVVTDYQGSA